MFTGRILEYEAHKNQQQSSNIKITHQKLIFGIPCHLTTLMSSKIFDNDFYNCKLLFSL